MYDFINDETDLLSLSMSDIELSIVCKLDIAAKIKLHI